MLHLYIDTNVYLTFFHLSSEELDELDKLRVIVENTNEIVLHLPEQTLNEFERNRETKIADALKRYNEEKLSNQFPIMCKNYPQYSGMMRAIKEFSEHKAKLLELLNNDIETHKLKADKIISSLFENAKFHKYESYRLLKAKERFDLGNPPGKDKSYGDAINWETLLEVIPNSDDLYFISDDKDFYSVLNSSVFNSYLTKEWEKKKNSKLYSYRRISHFFQNKFPDIKFTSEYEKDFLIQELSVSSSFASTRRILKKLSTFEDFSLGQLNEFLQACTYNTQVYWIANDYDVIQMVRKILDPYIEKVDSKLLHSFDHFFSYYGIAIDIDTESIEFDESDFKELNF